MLELKNITKTFGSVIANNDVSITVHKGTIHAIVGENGAGKSTIMRIAYGFYNADSGEIFVDGNKVDIRNPHDAIALGIGMVHQHFMLVDTMTVAENIGSPLRLRGEKNIAARVKELAARLHIEPFLDRLPAELSGGQQQRVALARALAKNAPLMLLDEPLGALDRKLREHMQIEIKRLHRETGATIIYVTHDPKAAEYANQTLHLDKGTLVEAVAA